MKNTSKKTPPYKVLITGSCGSLGRQVATELCQNNQIIGVDKRPFGGKHDNIEHLQIDLHRKSSLAILRKKAPNCIIHLGVIRNPAKHNGNTSAYYYNLETTAQLLNLAKSTNVAKFIFLSTANLYGASRATSGFLDEDTPLHGANKSPEIRDLVSLDMMIQSFFWKQPSTKTVILRPCHIIGPTLRNGPSRYLRQFLVPTLLGFDPMIQFIYIMDVIKAIKLAMQPKICGIFNLTSNDQVPLSRILKKMDKISVPIPEMLFRQYIKKAFGYGLSIYPPGELDHLKYSCLISGQRAKDSMNFTADYSTSETLEIFGR